MKSTYQAIELLNFYAQATFVFTVVSCLFIATRRLNEKFQHFTPKLELRFQRIAMVLVSLFVSFMNFASSEYQFVPISKSQISIEIPSTLNPLSFSGENTMRATEFIGSDFFNTNKIIICLLLVGIAYFLIRYVFRLVKTLLFLKSCTPLWNRGSVRVRVGRDSNIGAFSFWVPFATFVYLPQEYLLDRNIFNTALLHECQHHRNQDTKFVHVHQIVSSIFFWNPAIAAWMRSGNQLHEFACDEALVDRGGLNPRRYAAQLVDAAKQNLSRSEAMDCAPGILKPGSGNILRQRIHMLLNGNRKSNLKSVSVFVLASSCLFGLASFYSKGFALSDRISPEYIRALESQVPTSTSFTVTLNEQVLAELNDIRANPARRKFFKDSIERSEAYKETIEAILSKKNMPLELVSIPLAESGYRNRIQNPSRPNWGAGLWMIIKSTALQLGLKVDNTTDERMDPILATNAATELLLNDYKIFKDWNLAVLAFNIGGRNLQRDIEAKGTRDPWKLIEGGVENDKNYLAKVLASVLLMKYPELR